jgi:hypothetical protein
VSDLARAMTDVTLFLFSKDEKPIGTAFIVGYPVPDRPEKYFPLVVTAKHVVGDAAEIVGRFSMEGDQIGIAKYDIAQLRKDGDVWEHPEDGVDLLVFRSPHFEKVKYRPLAITNIASKEIFTQEEIAPTDKVVFPCMLVHFMGTTQNYPIIRDGSVALIPDEPVPLEYDVGKRHITTRQQIIMIDATSIPGASGSPVFLWPGPRAKGGVYSLGTKSWLLGIMHGFFQFPREAREVETQLSKYTVFDENTRIAIIFPSWRLLEILSGEKLKERIKVLNQGST